MENHQFFDISDKPEIAAEILQLPIGWSLLSGAVGRCTQEMVIRNNSPYHIHVRSDDVLVSAATDQDITLLARACFDPEIPESLSFEKVEEVKGRSMIESALYLAAQALRKKYFGELHLSYFFPRYVVEVKCDIYFRPWVIRGCYLELSGKASPKRSQYGASVLRALTEICRTHGVTENAELKAFCTRATG